jgi:hypothetical protein
MLINEFVDRMKSVREEIAKLVPEAKEASLCARDATEGMNGGEMAANSILAMRHLEDAAMRFGKAIQAASGGVSPLGGPDTPITK